MLVCHCNIRSPQYRLILTVWSPYWFRAWRSASTACFLAQQLISSCTPIFPAQLNPPWASDLPDPLITLIDDRPPQSIVLLEIRYGDGSQRYEIHACYLEMSVVMLYRSIQTALDLYLSRNCSGHSSMETGQVGPRFLWLADMLKILRRLWPWHMSNANDYLREYYSLASCIMSCLT